MLLSVTEGADKPFKYPGIFSKADVALLTKLDLLPHVQFDLATVVGQIETLREGVRVLGVAATTGDGVDELAALLCERSDRCKAAAVR